MAYNTLAEFKTRSLLPPEYVDAVEAVQPGFTAAQLESCARLDIDARLAKRYAVPFSAPVPEAVKTWEARIVSLRVSVRHGAGTVGTLETDIRDDAAAAKREIEEAANSETGLFDLPLRADTAASGISKGRPRGYSEQSPYVWMDGQACVGRNEDASGRGT